MSSTRCCIITITHTACTPCTPWLVHHCSFLPFLHTVCTARTWLVSTHLILLFFILCLYLYDYPQPGDFFSVKCAYSFWGYLHWIQYLFQKRKKSRFTADLVPPGIFAGKFRSAYCRFYLSIIIYKLWFICERNIILKFQNCLSKQIIQKIVTLNYCLLLQAVKIFYIYILMS